MIRVNNREGFEFVEHDGYCFVVHQFIELSGIRTWKLATGRGIFSAHEADCPYANECNSSRGCKLIAEARQKWAEEAEEDREAALEEMLPWC